MSSDDLAETLARREQTRDSARPEAVERRHAGGGLATVDADEVGPIGMQTANGVVGVAVADEAEREQRVRELTALAHENAKALNAAARARGAGSSTPGERYVAPLMEGRRDKPRIPPGTREETGVVNAAIARGIGLAAGGPAPHIFTTLGRHRRLFRRWLRFAGALMPGGGLPRHDSELVILRVAHNCGCDYELHHHEALGRIAGLSAEEIERAAEGPEAPGWSERQRLLLRAVDELHADRVISDELWGPLESHLSETDLIELCMLVGHYEMLAMTLNSLGVQRDHAPPNPPRALRAAERIRTRRARQRSA